MVTTVRYTNPEETQIMVDETISMNWPSDTHYDAQVQAWLDAGNTIEPYDEYYGWTLEQAKQNKVSESEEYAQALIDDAFSNPTQGTTAVPAAYKRRQEARRKDKADKQAGEITLTQEEKDQAKTDQKLSEYETKCWDASDKAIEEIDKGTTVDGVMSIDIATVTTWPVWTPPL